MGMIWTKESIDYSKKCEIICAEYFSLVTGATGWFFSVQQNPMNNRIDFTGVDIRGRKAKIELKNRKMTINTHETIMIEPEKYDALTGSTTEKNIYINFLGTPEKFWLCEVTPQLNSIIEMKNNIPIDNKNLSEKHKYKNTRYFIDKKLGHYFEYSKTENKYIKIW